MVIATVLGGLYFIPGRTEAVSGFIVDMASPDHTYRGAEWQKDGVFMLAVGNDSLGNGVVDRYHSEDGVWETLHSSSGGTFNDIAKTESLMWYDGMEGGQNGWSTTSWKGNLSWHQVNPLTLPAAVSGTSHGTANHGEKIWWFGNDTTGTYDDGTDRVVGSMYSPLVTLPDISSTGAIVFWHWFEVEGGGNYDSMIVSIKNVSDSGWCELKRWDSSVSSFTAWRQELIMISGWLGNQIRLNFTFDSQDGEANHYAGWHIDDFLIYSNEMYIAVGEPGVSGYSAYAIDGYGTAKTVLGMNGYDFNGVARGQMPLSFMAVGDGGAALYFDGYGWHEITGAKPGDVLTSVDFNGTHFFIVGYDSGGHGVAYYYNEAEIYAGQSILHPIMNVPDWKLNDISWNNEYPTIRGYGMGAVAAEGTAMSISDPETWYHIPTAVAPSARLGHAMAYDSAHDVVVLFGGFNGIGLDDTWIYNMAMRTWTQVFPVQHPSARRYHEMVYDPNNGVVILFGGYPYSGETWAYDYLANTWTQKANGPGARCYHAMAFDKAVGKTILFGGYYDTAPLGDTWAYNYASDTWTPGGSSPGQRNSHAMAFDPINKRTVMFGGMNQIGLNVAETWTYDAVADLWVNVNPSAPPSARSQHSMVYDAVSGKVILFGGNTGSPNDETWAYDTAANKWVNLFPARKPAARSCSEMAYSSLHGQTVLFGGDYHNYSDDTWYCVAGSPWNGNVVDRAVGMNGENLTAVAWNNDNKNALFVGHNSSHAVVYSFYYGNDYLALASGSSDTLAGHQLYSLAYNPDSRSDEVVLLGASAFMMHPLMSDSSTRLMVHTEYPHIFDIDFREQSTGISRENQQVNVNGNYTFYIEANYTIGGIDHWTDASIAIAAWYDEGHVGLASMPEGSWVSAVNRTRQLGINYDAGLGAAVVSYPVTPNLEFTLHSFWEDPMIYLGSRHRVYINVTFHNQTRAADGRGFLNGSASDSYDRAQAFNDPHSWDYVVHVYDTLLTNAYAECYEEFGVNEWVSVSVQGNPSCNAPPGAVDVPMVTPSQITYSSNAPYCVNVSIPHLYKDGNILSPYMIGAGNVSVINAAPTVNATNSYIPVQKHFPETPDTGMDIWGLNGTFLGSPLNGTVSAGPWVTDYNAPGLGLADYTVLYWWVTVQAGVPEGVYWGKITVSITT